MVKIWDSTPTTTGKHRAPTSRTRCDINRRAAVRLTAAAILLCTVVALLGTRPAALVALGYYAGLPVAIVTTAALTARLTGRLGTRAVRR